MVPLCQTWVMCGKRNNHTFNGVEVSVIELKSSYLRTLYEWSHTLGCNMHSIEFIDSCFLRIILSHCHFLGELFMYVLST